MKENAEISNRGALNLDEAARFMGINHASMSALVRRPDFPAFRMGRRWVIPREALVRWLDKKAKERAEL